MPMLSIHAQYVLPGPGIPQSHQVLAQVGCPTPAVSHPRPIAVLGGHPHLVCAWYVHY